MEKFIAGFAVAVFALVLWAGVMFGIWSLWCYVLPQVYATGAPGLVSPGFWLFAACWTLVVFVGRAIFGGKK